MTYESSKRTTRQKHKQFNKNKQRWGCIAKKEACSIRVKTEKPKGQKKGSEIKKKNCMCPRNTILKNLVDLFK